MHQILYCYDIVTLQKKKYNCCIRATKEDTDGQPCNPNMLLQLPMTYAQELSSSDTKKVEESLSPLLVKIENQYGSLDHYHPSNSIVNSTRSVAHDSSTTDIESDITIPKPSTSLSPPPPPPPSLSTSFTCPLQVSFVAGSVPHSVLVATAIGIACGVSAYIYNSILQWALITVWKTWSQQILSWILHDNHEYYTDSSIPTWTILWIPIVAFTLSIGLGYTVRFVGEPGDLASTIQCVHIDGFLELNHATPMIIASLFSIVAASSVGPEAALVAVCATLAGYISQTIFGTDPKIQRNLIRKHTLMGVRFKLKPVIQFF
jgi:hypothetical protein